MKLSLALSITLLCGCASKTEQPDSYDLVVERATELYEAGATDSAIQLLTTSPSQKPQPSSLLAHAELAHDLPLFSATRLARAKGVLKRIPLENFSNSGLKVQVLSAWALISISEGNIAQARADFRPLCGGTDRAFGECLRPLISNRIRDLELSSRPRSARESMFVMAKVADTLSPAAEFKADQLVSLLELKLASGLRLRADMIEGGQYSAEVRESVCERLMDIKQGYSPLISTWPPELNDVYSADCLNGQSGA